MKQITITTRVTDKTCIKCGYEMKEGDKAMVQRNQSGGHYFIRCWGKMCL